MLIIDQEGKMLSISDDTGSLRLSLQENVLQKTLMQMMFLQVSYALTENSLSIVPQEIYLLDRTEEDRDWGKTLTAQENLLYHASMNRLSSTSVLPSGTTVEVIGCDMKHWAQMKRSDTGEMIYMYFFSTDPKMAYNKVNCYTEDMSVTDAPFSNMMFFE